MESSSGCIQPINTPAPALAWLFASALLKGTEDAFGSNPSRAGAAHSSQSLSDARPGEQFFIIAIEDNLADVWLIEEALALRGLKTDLKNVRDGEDALALIRGIDADETAPCPTLFLLDLNIPTKNGAEVLAKIRSSNRCAAAPVIVVTSSNSLQDRENLQRLGANSYFCKPADLDAFMALGEIVEGFLRS